MSGLKILFLVGSGKFFLSHRLDLANKLIDRGLDITVMSYFTPAEISFLESTSIKIVKSSDPRSFSFSPFLFLIKLIKYQKSNKPKIIHIISLSLFLRFGFLLKISQILNFSLPNKRIISVTGLGSLFISGESKLKNGVIKFFIESIFKISVSNGDHFIVQNKDTMEYLTRRFGIDESRISLIEGSGIEVRKNQYRRPSLDPLVVSMASRILRDKGVMEYLAASKIVSRQLSRPVKFQLCGEFDSRNPSSLIRQEFFRALENSNVEFLGEIDDVPSLYTQSTLVVLPSYLEGLPKSLIEAAACGRCIVTTDVPGCRDVIEHLETGILVTPRDANSLANGIMGALSDFEFLVKSGIKARRRARIRFGLIPLVLQHEGLYRQFESV